MSVGYHIFKYIYRDKPSYKDVYRDKHEYKGKLKVTYSFNHYEFDYIIPYVNLLDPSWDLFLFHMGLAMGL